MKDESLPVLDLSKPEDCRKFLKDLSVDGKKVREFTLENGNKISTDEMNNSQLIQYANEIYFDWLNGKPEGGVINTDIDRGLQ